MLGNGGRVSFGTEGMVGKAVGSGGKVGFGKDGCAVVGSVGTEGKGGNADGLGKFGKVGNGGNCSRRRDVNPTSMEENIVKATKKAEIKHLLLEAIVRCRVGLIFLNGYCY